MTSITVLDDHASGTTGFVTARRTDVGSSVSCWSHGRLGEARLYVQIADRIVDDRRATCKVRNRSLRRVAPPLFALGVADLHVDRSRWRAVRASISREISDGVCVL